MRQEKREAGTHTDAGRTAGRIAEVLVSAIEEDQPDEEPEQQKRSIVQHEELGKYGHPTSHVRDILTMMDVDIDGTNAPLDRVRQYAMIQRP